MPRALHRIRFNLSVPPRAVEAVARLRLESARRPWARWAIVATFALAAGVTVHGKASALDAARDAWGERRAVLVALHPVGRGEAIRPADVRRRELPLAALAGDAVGELPVGAIAVDGLAIGEVVTSTHVRGRGRGELPAGTSGVAVPLADGSLPVVVGQIVDLVRAGDPLDGATSAASVLARRAQVIDVSSTTVVVAVASADAPAAAAAAARGAVVLILSEM